MNSRLDTVFGFGRRAAHWPLAAAVLSLALGGCGGGGGDGGGGSGSGGGGGGGGGNGGVVVVPPPGGEPVTTPSITVQPMAQSAVSRQGASFSITATGGGLFYKWSRSVDGGASWTLIDGNNSPTLLLPAVTRIDDGTLFRVTVANTAGNLNSAAAALSVTPNLALFAGHAGAVGASDGPAASARFNGPRAAVYDAAGNLYVTDNANHTIRRISTSGVVTTLAGRVGVPGFADGSGNDARLHFPTGLALDGNGDLLVADALNRALRRITPGGVVSTVALAAPGSAVSTLLGGVAVSSTGQIFVADRGGNTIYRIANGQFELFSGQASGDFVDAASGTDVRLRGPNDLWAGANGSLYVADLVNRAIRVMDAAGGVTTLAGGPLSPAGVGSGPVGLGAGSPGLAQPRAVALNPGDGALYFIDGNAHLLRRITSGGSVQTVAGLAGQAGTADGVGSAARFFGLGGLTLAPDNSLVLVETAGHRIRRVVPDGGGAAGTAEAGLVNTLAGVAPQPGAVNGSGVAARFNDPRGVVADAAGNAYVADAQNSVIRRITPAGEVSVHAGAFGSPGSADGPAATARFATPWALAIDATGVLYVADRGSLKIRRIATDGTVSTVAGQASFVDLTAIAVEPNGDLLVGERFALQRIRGNVLTTVAGDPNTAGTADGSAAQARFATITGIVAAANGDIFVAAGSQLRRISGGSVGTFAGAAGAVAAEAGFVDGPAATARFSDLSSLASLPNGEMVVTDFGNNAVRRISRAGAVTTLLGRPERREFNAGSKPSLAAPVGVAALPGGTLVITSENGVLIE